MKRQPPKAGSRFGGGFGWMTAAVVLGAWAWTDGRPVRYAAVALDAAGRQAANIVPGGDRVAALIRSDDSTHVAASAARPPPSAAPADRTGSIRPTPRPSIETRGAEQRSVPVPAATPIPPLPMPSLDMAMAQHRPVAVPAAVAPVGTERHATRTLRARFHPDESAARLGDIESGSSVSVLRTAGQWRYVRNVRTGVEGWVDGRYLAGEAMSADLAALARIEPRADR